MKAEYITCDFLCKTDKISLVKYAENFSLIQYGENAIGIERWYNLPQRTLTLLIKELKRLYPEHKIIL